MNIMYGEQPKTQLEALIAQLETLEPHQAEQQLLPLCRALRNLLQEIPCNMHP